MKKLASPSPTNQERIRHLALLCQADRLELRLLAAPTPPPSPRSTLVGLLTSTFAFDAVLGLMPLLPAQWGKWITYGANAYKVLRQTWRI